MKAKQWIAALLCLLLFFSAAPAAHAAYYAAVIDSPEDPRIPDLLAAVENQNFSGSGADAESALTVIRHFLFDSPFAAIGGGLFPYPNSGPYTCTVTDGTYTAEIPGSAGCYAHCRFMSMVIYGALGTATEERVYTAEEIADLLRREGQAGEHLRISGRHSLCFISCDETGFYALSYQGDSSPEGGRIALVYWNYEDFTAKYKNVEMWLFNCADGENDVPAFCALGEECPSLLYTDVPGPENWAHEGIDAALRNGWLIGTAPGVFAPDLVMTRAMLVTVLWRIAGEPETETPAPFDDVPEDEWYAEAAAWAAEAGITAGTAERCFSPDLPVTREQTAAILYRFAAPDPEETPPETEPDRFADRELVSEWAAEAMDWAVGRELISGAAEDGQFFLLPQGGTTRAEAAAILMRYESL